MVRAFRRLILLHLCVQEWFVWLTVEKPAYSTSVILFCAVAYTLGLVLGWRPRWSRAAFVFVLVISIVRHVNQFPLSANHHYLELGILALGSLFDERSEDESRLLLQSCRCVVVTVMFYAGLQKVMHGYYFSGELLSFAIAMEPRFAETLGWLLPGEELERLRSYGLPPPVGAGPYYVSSPLLMLVSNATYALEMLAAVGFLVPRLRTLTLVGAVALIVAIEVSAREVLFGGLYVGLMLLFAPRAVNARVLPLFVALYAYLVAAGFGVVPRWGAH